MKLIISAKLIGAVSILCLSVLALVSQLFMTYDEGEYFEILVSDLFKTKEENVVQHETSITVSHLVMLMNGRCVGHLKKLM